MARILRGCRQAHKRQGCNGLSCHHPDRRSYDGRPFRAAKKPCYRSLGIQKHRLVTVGARALGYPNKKNYAIMLFMKNKAKRIEIIDALRGLSVVLMVAHHLLYNLVALLGAPRWFFTNPAFDVLQPFFAGLFIFLSGVSSRFSSSNIKRGIIAFALAIVITLATELMNMPIWWGVLHLLAFCMIFFGVTHKLWDKISKKISPFLFIALIVFSAIATSQIHITYNEPPWLRYLLSILGWSQRGFVSYDYFPILPWIFVFLLGTWAGTFIRDRKLPNWFYEFDIPIFPEVGRKALIVYIVHQPILYGLVAAISQLTNNPASLFPS